MQDTQWGGLALPTEIQDRPEFVKAILRHYTQDQINEFPVLKYIQEKYAL